LIELKSGIWFGKNLVLDPTRVQPNAVVTHAHTDHLKRHKAITGTPETLDLSRVVVGEFDKTPLNYGQTYSRGDVDLRLEPAGHMLGSSQCIIDYKGYRTVYTGDFKLSRNETCYPADIHNCDILFLDTTFGKPVFEFPDYSRVKQRLLEFVDGCLTKSIVPVIYAYDLGKAQEVIKILGDEDYNTYITDKAMKIAEIYNKYGVDLKNYFIQNGNFPDYGALVVPPSSKNGLSLPSGTKYKTCFVSGWAVNQSYIGYLNADCYIPLSDHASYSDLLRYVETAKPRKIYCLFGFKDIVDDLKLRGYNAVKATIANQKNVSRYALEELDLFYR